MRPDLTKEKIVFLQDKAPNCSLFRIQLVVEVNVPLASHCVEQACNVFWMKMREASVRMDNINNWGTVLLTNATGIAQDILRWGSTGRAPRLNEQRRDIFANSCWFNMIALSWNG